MKGLDFKDWEKISEDKKSTTLKHSKGHVMVIAHGALPKIQKEQLKRLKFADGTPSGTVGDAAAPSSDSDDSSSRYSLGANIGDLSSIGGDSSYNDMIKAMAGSPEVAAQVPGYTGQAPYQGSDPVSIPQVQSQRGGGVSGILNTEQQGITQGELIAAEKAKAEAAYQDQFLKETQALKERDHRDIHTLNGSVQTLHDYVKEYPMNKNAIFDDMKAPARITNAIGLLIGGFTGGFNGTGVNPAMNYLMDQQNKDIQAQKDRMDQQRTVFGAFHQAYGDDVIASNLARVSYNNMLIHKGHLMAAKLGTPQSAQAANMLSSALSKDNYLKLGQAAQRARAIHSGQIPAPESDQAQSANVQDSKQGGPNVVSPNMEQQQPNPKNQGERDPFLYKPEPILTPEAEAIYQHLKFDPRVSDERKHQVTVQYNNAKQAQKYLDALPAQFNDMANNATQSGLLGRSFQGLPYVGDGAEKVLSGGMALYNKYAPSKLGGTGEDEIDTNRKYRSGETLLREALQNSSHGPAASPHGVEDTLKANKPERGDLENPDTYVQKLKAFESYIKNGNQLGELEALGMARSPRRSNLTI